MHCLDKQVRQTGDFVPQERFYWKILTSYHTENSIILKKKMVHEDGVCVLKCHHGQSFTFNWDQSSSTETAAIE